MNTRKNLIGAHISIAGGIDRAPQRAHEQGCETFQCFTRSPQGGPAPELTADLVARFRSEMSACGMSRFYIHAPYYINLASPEARIRHSSIRVIREELERGSALGASYVMFHPGSFKDQSQDEAVSKVGDALFEILNGYEGTTELLVEISAGAGNVLGDTFQENADMIKGVTTMKGFGGICFDTCHAFASGYDFRTTDQSWEMLGELDRIIGLKWLKLSHVQDSKSDLGGHKDRHEHIGNGFIGLSGLASILQTTPFSGVDWILETEDSGRLEDIKKLKKIRG